MFLRHRLCIPSVAIVLLLFLLFWLSSGARQPVVEAQPVMVQLLAQAQGQGQVRVIVGIDVNARPEGDLDSGQAITDQRDAIERAQDAVVTSVAGRNATTVTAFETIPYLVLEVDAEALTALANHPQVLSIAADQIEAPTLAESISAVGADTVRQETSFTGAGWAIAVIDTGIDLDHPAFQQRVVAGACFNTTNPTNNSVTRCPNGLATDLSLAAGDDCNVDIVAGCSHGTHVAGIAAGNSTVLNIVGVAPAANLIAINAFSQFTGGLCSVNGLASPCVLSYISDQIKGLEHLVTLHNQGQSIAAVNLSLGGGVYDNVATCDAAQSARKAVIDNLRSLGIVTIAAAGNRGYATQMQAPACISSVVSVGSTGDGGAGAPFDEVSTFSDSADFLDLLAPGAVVLSAGSGSEPTLILSGTSMSTPLVAGAWALLKEQTPTVSIETVLTRLKQTGILITDRRAGAQNRQTPRLQVDTAVGLQPKTPAGLRASSTGSGQVELHWSDTTNDNGFIVERQTSTDTWAAVATTAPNATSYLDSGLECDVAYTYRVIATNANGNAPPPIAATARTGSVRSANYSYSGAPVALTNGVTQTFTIDIVEGGTIADLDIGFSGTISEPYQLALALIAPDGTTAALTSSTPDVNSGSLSGTSFDDEAERLLKAATTPFVGGYRPDNQLAVFDGKDIAGTWTLTVVDRWGTVGVPAGTVQGFDLMFALVDNAPCPVGPTPTSTMVATATPTSTLTPTPTIPGTPTASINTPPGRPGSDFLMVGGGFAAGTNLLVQINGTLVGTLQTDQQGRFAALLDTPPAALPGDYDVVLQLLPADPTVQPLQLRYTVVSDAPLQTPQLPDSGFIIEVPETIRPATTTSRLYLPLVLSE